MPWSEVAGSTGCRSGRVFQVFLRRQENVIHFYGPCTDLHRPLYVPRSDSNFVITAPAVQSLCQLVAGAHGQAHAAEPKVACFLLGRLGEGRRNAPPSIGRSYGDVLQFGWVRQGKIDMTQGLFFPPGHQVMAVALVEPR